MKTLVFTFSFLIFGIFNFCLAQNINIPSTLDVSEGKAMLDDVERNGFRVTLAGTEKEIIKSFEDFLESQDKNYDVKSLFKKISAEDILVPSFSEKHINLNAQVREKGSSIQLWYWVSFGTDIYVNSSEYPDEAAKCKTLLKEFARSYFADFVSADIETTSEKMEDSEDNLADIIDDIKDLTKDEQKAVKNRGKIEKKKENLKSELTELQIEIKEKEAEIEKVDADLEVLSTKLSKKQTDKTDIESKISEQKQTLQELKARLAQIRNM